MKKKYSDGGVYEGEGTFFTKKRDGHGKMIYANGDVYEGEWKDDVRCGEGELYHMHRSTKTYSYKGTWMDDKLNGQGTFTDATVTYSGEFLNGVYHGKGTLYKKLRSTSTIYSTYVGDFAYGQKHGMGSEKCAEYTYTGAYAKDQFHGKGKKVLANKDYYDGTFVIGSFSAGKVRLTEPTGDIYEGSYKKYHYEGSGKLKMTDGTVYSGHFKNGQLNGVVTITKPDGTKVKEKFENGIPLSEKEVQNVVQEPQVEKAKDAPKKESAKKETIKKETAKKEAIKKESTKKDDVKASGVKKEQADKKSIKKEENKNSRATSDNGQNDKATFKKLSSYKKKPMLFAKKLEELNLNMDKVNQSVAQSVKNAEAARKAAQELTGKLRLRYDGKKAESIIDSKTQETDKYYGGFSFNDKIDGEGIYEWASGDKYFGEHVFGYRSGTGYYESENGSKYFGKWWDNDKHGPGVHLLSDGEKYLGDFVKNDAEGYGKRITSIGNIYEGGMKKDRHEGYGTYVWSEKSQWPGDKYVGQWKEGRRHGFGVYYCADGTTYIGDWLDGKYHGKIVITLKDGDWYEGDCSDNERNGHGIYRWKSGELYDGEWKDDARTGNGTYYFVGGTVYQGGFLKGKVHGKGAFFYPNGDRIDGEFDNGDLLGNCICTHQDGTQETGKLVDGKFVSDQNKGDASDRRGQAGGSASINTDAENCRSNIRDLRSTGDSNNTNNSNNSSNANNEKNASEDEKKMFTPVSGGGITFDDVAGLSEVKDEIINHVIEPLRNPELAKAFGIKPGGKILLYGPPGTGKTYIARAIAGEIDAAFYSVSCQDLISKWLGESSERISKLFDEAQQHDKAIIFFDEFDSVASKRDSENDSPAMARFLATFLTKVDGFKPIENKMLLLIAATNRPWALDSAILRGGRFDRQIYVSLPDKEARDFLVNKAIVSLPLDENLSLSIIADSLEGFGGSDIVSICEKIRFEAYKKSIKSKQIEKITLEDCQNAMKGVQNHISQKELDRFEEYRQGLID